MTDPIRRPLPDSLMKAIRATLADDDATVAERLQATLMIVHGYGLWVRADTIDPNDLKIPEPQWTEIAGWLQQAGRTDLEKVNLPLEWMNRGPAAYETVGSQER